MALELIAAIVAAVALAGMAHLARRLSGYRLPRWLVPFAGGLGLIGFTVWSEYDWFNRVSAELPPGVEVVWTERSANPLRPWTYLAPMTTRFVVLDTRDIARHPVKTELRLAHIYNFARWRPTEDAMMVFDCAANRQVLLTEAVTLDADGTLHGSDWVETTSDDAFHEAACREGQFMADAARKPKVLVVEDEDNIAIALDYLITREGYACDRVASGGGALAHIRQTHPDLVLLDVMLPEVSGYEICQNVRLDPHLSDVKILMMTARGSAVERRKGLALGADGFISKPFELDDLRKQVRLMLEREV